MSNRSYLFVPAVSTKMMTKALNSESDSVIFDLEDAVAISEKEEVRERMKNYLFNNPAKKETYIRVNDFTTNFWKEDLLATIEAGANGIIVPKAESSHNLRTICETAVMALEKKKRDIFQFSIIPLIETARGIQFAFEVATAHFLIKRLAFGSIDYSLDIDCERTADGIELLYARSQIVNASKAAGLEGPIDSVYPILEDVQGLNREALTARILGFKGKLAIHPKQLNPIHAIFSPSQKAVEEALEIVEAFEAAVEQGIASIRVGNQFIDYPVYKKAKQLLKFSKQS